MFSFKRKQRKEPRKAWIKAEVVTTLTDGNELKTHYYVCTNDVRKGEFEKPDIVNAVARLMKGPRFIYVSDFHFVNERHIKDIQITDYAYVEKISW